MVKSRREPVVSNTVRLSGSLVMSQDTAIKAKAKRERPKVEDESIISDIRPPLPPRVRLTALFYWVQAFPPFAALFRMFRLSLFILVGWILFYGKDLWQIIVTLQ